MNAGASTIYASVFGDMPAQRTSKAGDRPADQATIPESTARPHTSLSLPPPRSDVRRYRLCNGGIIGVHGGIYSRRPGLEGDKANE